MRSRVGVLLQLKVVLNLLFNEEDDNSCLNICLQILLILFFWNGWADFFSCFKREVPKNLFGLSMAWFHHASRRELSVPATIQSPCSQGRLVSLQKQQFWRSWKTLNYIVCFWRHSPRIQCLLWMLKKHDANSGCVFTPTNSWVQFTILCHYFGGIL